LGIDTCVETSGAGCIDDVYRLARLTRLFLWDIKAIEPITDEQLKKLKMAESAGAKIRLRSVLVQRVNAELLRERLLQTAGKLEDCKSVELLPYNVFAPAKASGARNGFLLPVEGR